MELRNHCEPDWVYPHQDRIESESHSGHQRIRNWDRGVEAADGRIADPPPQETPRLELHAVSAIRALIVHLIVPYRLSPEGRRIRNRTLKQEPAPSSIIG